MAGYEVKVKGLTKLNKVVSGYSKLNKEQKAVNKNLKTQKQLTDKLTSSTTGKINDMSKKFQEMTGSTVLERPLNAFSKSFEFSRKKGQGLFSSVKTGFGGMGKAISRMGGLSKVFGLVFKSAMKVLWPLGLIMTAIAVIKKLFQLNVGGMATGFFKVVGEIKSALGQMMGWINRSLRKLDPLFKMVFTPIIQRIRLVFAIIKGVFKGVAAIVTPIIDVLAEIGKAFSGVFGDSKGQAAGFEQVLKGITKTLEVIGKIIGWLLKVALKPLMITFKILGFLISRVIEDTKKGFQTWYKILKPVFDMIKKIIDFFKKGAEKNKEKRETLMGTIKEKYPIASALLGGGTTNNTTKNDNRRISVHTNSGIDANSFNEDSAVRSLRG